jgi:hypothetical protein
VRGVLRRMRDRGPSPHYPELPSRPSHYPLPSLRSGEVLFYFLAFFATFLRAAMFSPSTAPEKAMAA